MGEKHILEAGDTLTCKYINDVPPGESNDAVKAIGSNITLHDVHCVDEICRAEPHSDFIQLIPTKSYLRYFGEISENVKITNCSLYSDGSMQGIFSSDGAYRNLEISNVRITTKSEHDVSICGLLSGTIMDVNNRRGTKPARVFLDNMRIGGGEKSGFYITSFKNHQYEEIKTCQRIEDQRGAKWRDAVYVDNFDLDLWYKLAKKINYKNVKSHLSLCKAAYYVQTGVKI